MLERWAETINSIARKMGKGDGNKSSLVQTKIATRRRAWRVAERKGCLYGSVMVAYVVVDNMYFCFPNVIDHNPLSHTADVLCNRLTSSEQRM